ncbi:MAG TPA: sigma-70 family RNA polymerase sigma factor [Gemmata sp.]
MSQRVRGLLDRLLARQRETAGDGVPDAELLRRFARERDEAAFELLVWRHGPMVLDLCRRAVRDEQRAEDAFQAVFLVLARKAGGVRGNLGGWLFRVARRVAHRAATRHTATAPPLETAAPALPDPVERAELYALLDDAIARLPERLRKPVVLCYLGGHSTEDAARELGCPRGTVLSRLATARKCLAKRLARRGVTLPTVLAVSGAGGLTPRTVSAALASVRQYALDPGAITIPISLANGVLHAMNRTTLLTALGASLALALASGVGLVVAQNGPPAAVASGAAGTPAAPPAPPTKPAPDVAEQEAEKRLTKLERFRSGLQQEIDLIEKQIQLIERENKKGEGALLKLHARLADVERVVLNTERDIARLESEVRVLQKLIRDKETPVEPTPAAVEQALARDPAIAAAAFKLKESQARLERAQGNSANPLAPALKDLKATVAAHEKELQALRAEATAGVVTKLKAAEAEAQKKRLEELTLQITVKQEERNKLRQERDTIKKVMDATAVPDVRAEELWRSIEPHREMLAKVQREIMLIQAQRKGISFNEQNSTDAKLDAILRELATLRKEVKELKEKK